MITSLVLLTLNTSVVVSVDDMLAALGRQMEMRITASNELRRNVVFVEPRGASVDAQLDAVARALHASVVKEKGEIRLERSNKDRRDMLEKCMLVREKWIDGRIDRVARYRSGFGPSSTPEGFFKAAAIQLAQLDEAHKGKRTSIDQVYPEQVLPSQSLLEALIERIGRKKLAAVETGAAEVFTSSGGPGTLRLPACDDLLQSYEIAMQPFREAVRTDDQMKSLRQIPNLVRIVDSWPSRAPVDRLRLIVQSMPTGLVVEFSGFNAEGLRVFDTFLDMGPADGSHSSCGTASSQR